MPGGRPKKDDGKTKNIRVRLSEVQMMMLHDLTESTKRSMSDILRDGIYYNLRKER